MRAIVKVTNPDDIEVTLTLTTTLGQWKKLRDQLPIEWPAMHLSQAIDGVVSNAQRAMYVDVNEPEGA